MVGMEQPEIPMRDRLRKRRVFNLGVGHGRRRLGGVDHLRCLLDLLGLVVGLLHLLGARRLGHPRFLSLAPLANRFARALLIARRAAFRAVGIGGNAVDDGWDVVAGNAGFGARGEKGRGGQKRRGGGKECPGQGSLQRLRKQSRIGISSCPIPIMRPGRKKALFAAGRRLSPAQPANALQPRRRAHGSGWAASMLLNLISNHSCRGSACTSCRSRTGTGRCGRHGPRWPGRWG